MHAAVRLDNRGVVTAEDTPRKSLRQRAEEEGIEPIRSADDLAADVFESDEELEEFLAWLYGERHRDADMSRQRPEDLDDPQVWGPDEWP